MMVSSVVVLAFAATVTAAAYKPARRQVATVTSTVALNSTTTAINASYVQSVLETGLPSSLLAIAVTNPAAVSSIIASEFNANMTPDWFVALPTAVQTYLIGASSTANVSGIAANATAVANATATNGIYNSTTGLNGTVPGNGSAVLTTIHSTNSAGMTVNIVSTVKASATGTAASGATSSGATAASGSTASASRAGAAIPTAIIGGGLAGLVGLVGMLAL